MYMEIMEVKDLQIEAITEHGQHEAGRFYTRKLMIRSCSPGSAELVVEITLFAKEREDLYLFGVYGTVSRTGSGEPVSQSDPGAIHAGRPDVIPFAESYPRVS